MSDPAILEPKSDHEAIQYIAHKVDELSDDVQEIKHSTPDLATRDYVDQAVHSVDARLSDHISGKIDNRSDTSFFWRFFNSAIGQRIASFLMVLLLLGAMAVMNSNMAQTVIQEIQNVATAQAPTNTTERHNNGGLNTGD